MFFLNKIYGKMFYVVYIFNPFKLFFLTSYTFFFFDTKNVQQSQNATVELDGMAEEVISLSHSHTHTK